MKKKSPPYAIIGAVVLGLIAVFAFVQYTKQKDAEKQAAIDAEKANAQKLIDQANASKTATPIQITPTNMRPVLYATQPVQPGVKISPAFYEKKPTPNDILPDAFTEATDITGWVAIRNIEKGDPLTPRNIGKSLPYLTQRISPGMRAISLPIFGGDYNNTGGFVVDGDRVDLLYTVSTEGEKKFKVNTQTVMQNLKVLYVPAQPIKTEQSEGLNPVQPAGPIAITFEVTPEEAQALVFLSNGENTRFNMILRSRKDNSEIKIKPFDIRDYDVLKLTKVQKTIDASKARVEQLAEEIQAKENASQGTTNETTKPTPPTP